MRAAIVVSGVAAFCLGFALAASADAGSPASAHESAFKIALPDQAVKAAGEPAPAKPAATKPQPAKKDVKAPETRGEPVATPVPEHFVTQAPAPVVRLQQATPRGSVIARIVFGVGAKYRSIEAFIGRVASAGHDGSGSGTGVPVLVLGVLCAAAVFAHHRRYGRWATDENALDLLYARELTPPG